MAKALFGLLVVAALGVTGYYTYSYVSNDGKWLIQVFPKDQIWDTEKLAKFVADVRGVDPEVTGTPLQNFEAARQLREAARFPEDTKP